MEFIEAPVFTRHLHVYLNEENYRELQNELALNPKMGDVMPGAGGFRKARFRDSRRGKGRRGGLRIIYFYFESERQIWLMTLCGKNEVMDLTVSEKKTLKTALASELKLRRRGSHGEKKTI